MRRLAVALVAGVVLFAGCSSGGGKKAASKETKEAIESAGGNYCDLARNIENLDDDLLGGESGEITDEQIQDLQAIVAAFLGAAPDAIRDDAELLASSLDGLIEYLQIVGGDFTTDPSTLSEADQKRVAEIQEQFEDPRYQEASDRVDQYNQEECGIGSEDGGGEEAPAPEE